MGAAIGTEDSKSRNIELNIIPFIDLMSCLTAFLLVTAVWVNISSLNIKAEGKARDQQKEEPTDPQLSILLESDEIWVGISRVNDFTRIANTAKGYDWEKFAAVLKEQKTSAFFATTTDIQIAANSTTSTPIAYQALIHAMDTAVGAGFSAVHIADPAALYARPQL